MKDELSTFARFGHSAGEAGPSDAAMARLGPWPRRSYRAMRDYGLTEGEVAAYYGVCASVLRGLGGHSFDEGR